MGLMFKSHAVRSAMAFFLVTFSTAFLMTIGFRMTGWFTKAPDISGKAGEDLGIAIMIGVITLAVGAALRRMEASELRSAFLGAASVLIAIPLSEAAINHSWSLSTSIILAFGLLLLAAGLLVAVGIRAATPGAEPSEP
jgi:hypothetical protein